MSDDKRYFVQGSDVVPELLPWAKLEWLCNQDQVAAEQLMMVRATIEPGQSHAFHHHPNREEIIYVLSGRAEQWVEEECRILNVGEMALIPKKVVHGTYNSFDEPVSFLAIFSPMKADKPDLIDVSTEEPWSSLRSE